MKLKTISNFELEDFTKKHAIKLNGIFSKDDLPKPLPNGFYIVNLADESSPGTH